MQSRKPLLLLALACAAPAVHLEPASTPAGLTYEVTAKDRNPPQFPNGSAVPQTIPASGDPLCWGDPSADGRMVTGEFGEQRGHKSAPHAGVDVRAFAGNPIYAVADGCISFGNPTPRQLIGVKQRINDKFPNSTVWYLHLSRVAPKFINDGRSGACIPIRKGDLLGYSGNFYGSGGREAAAGAAHLHMSYFVSGLQLNPMPYVGAPMEIPQEFNTVKSVSDIATDVAGGGGTFSDSNASGTAGSRLGFGVPRMCNVYTVKGSGKQTIPYNGNFGVGNYSANASAPTQAALDDGQQRVRLSMGIAVDGKADGTIPDPSHWGGGIPEEPDWDSYSQMSLEQIISAEVSRRMADNRWAEQLTQQSERGLAMERAWITALRLKMKSEATLSQQRTEAMLAALLAVRARRLAQMVPPQNMSTPVR